MHNKTWEQGFGVLILVDSWILFKFVPRNFPVSCFSMFQILILHVHIALLKSTNIMQVVKDICETVCISSEICLQCWLLTRLHAAGNRLRPAADASVARGQTLRSSRLRQTQQAGKPAAAVARHQHCSGGCYTEGGIEDHAPRVWEGREGALPG